MKKILTIAIFAVLAIGLTGCGNNGTEPTASNSEPFVYENSESGFALTFPINWGTVKVSKSITPLAEDAEANVYLFTAEKDTARYVQVYVLSTEDKEKSWITDLPATLIEEVDDQFFYFNGSGDCYGKPGCEAALFKTILDESKEISASFKKM